MTNFNKIPIVQDVMCPVNEYNSFINFFQKRATKFSNNAYLHFQTLDYKGKIVVSTLTYEQVDRISTNIACLLQYCVGGKSVIALMEDHSVYYHVLVLAIYKLRIPVLLLSARNSSQAVCNLLVQTNSQALIYGASYNQIKEDVEKAITGIDCFPVPDMDLEKMANHPLNTEANKILNTQFSSEDLLKTLVIVHSSGTTGIPRAVQWSNRFLMYYIQAYQYSLYKSNQVKFIDESSDVSINLSPLCHSMGQFANFSSLVYGSSLFYFRQFPPSPMDVFDVIKKNDITRFVSPPYFISQIADHMRKIGDVEPFKKLKLIMSGGAPTPKILDDFFKHYKINLVSLYGMSECIGILSSDLDHGRVDSNTYFFMQEAEHHGYFEPFDKERLQLVYRANSPFLATGICDKINSDFKTKDLFIRSDKVEDAYIYVGRADDTLVLSNGEKTNPIPMEDAIKSNPMVRYCTVTGENRPCSAVLIELNFEFIKDYSLDTIVKKVHESVEKANIDAPSHSVILPEMVKFIPFAKHLPLSDKGTVIRKRAIHEFQDDVDEMYSKLLTSNSKKHKRNFTSNEKQAKIWDIVCRVLKTEKLEPNVSLFKQGLDSLLAVQLQNYISKEIDQVPQNFAYEHPTIEEMIRFFENDDENKVKEFNYQETTDILTKYLNLASKELVAARNVTIAKTKDTKQVVLLTGAAGHLGSNILLKLLENTMIKKVYVVMRGEGTDLISHISKSFERGNYPVSALEDRVQAISLSLEKDNLGLSPEIYAKLNLEVTMIQACGWMLDFNQPLSYYDSECIGGLYNLIKFANRKVDPISLHFISSVSASSAQGGVVSEKAMSPDPRIALPMGYAQSKFIVEQLLVYLIKQKNMPCYIYRVAQLCGDSTNGMWNTSEMYPLMLIGGEALKKMPSLNLVVDWLPLNFAADTIVNIMMETISFSAQFVFHIVNPNEIPWSSVLNRMKSCNMNFEIVDMQTWVNELALKKNNPAYKLLHFYKSLIDDKNRHCKWETKNTCILAPELKYAPTVNDGFSAYLKYWRQVGFYSN